MDAVVRVVESVRVRMVKSIVDLVILRVLLLRRDRFIELRWRR